MSTMTLPAEEIEWRDGREKVATRLLKATADKSYDPDVDIDWPLGFRTRQVLHLAKARVPLRHVAVGPHVARAARRVVQARVGKLVVSRHRLRDAAQRVPAAPLLRAQSHLQPRAIRAHRDRGRVPALA